MASLCASMSGQARPNSFSHFTYFTLFIAKLSEDLTITKLGYPIKFRRRLPKYNLQSRGIGFPV